MPGASHPLIELEGTVSNAVQTESFDAEALREQVEQTLAWCDTEVAHFVKKRKRYTDEHLADQVLRHEPDPKTERTWVLCNLQAAQDALRSAANRIVDLEKKGKSSFALAETRLLQVLSMDLLVFFPPAMKSVWDRPIDAVAGKRRVLGAIDMYGLAKMLMRREVRDQMPGDTAALPTAATLLRQTCELKLKNIVGVDRVEQPNGEPLRLRWDFFLTYAKANRKGLHLPVPSHLLEKIYSWSNATVHAGVVPFAWQVELAARLIHPMMRSGSHGDQWSAFGGTWVKQSVVDGVEAALQREYRAQQGGKRGLRRLFARCLRRAKDTGATKVRVQRMKPEAAVVPEDYDGSGPSEKLKKFWENLASVSNTPPTE